MDYDLKDKIQVTPELLGELANKGWQEIEQLQAQIANIETNRKSSSLIALLKNLLTSYYVFVGGIENLDKVATEQSIFDDQEIKKDFLLPDDLATKEEKTAIKVSKPDYAANTGSFEPFEYFVDFDEPSGEPLSDEDLYNNNY